MTTAGVLAGVGSAAGALILAGLALYWRRLPLLRGIYEPHDRLAAAARRFQSGVVNDYVTWAVLGLACLGGVLALVIRLPSGPEQRPAGLARPVGVVGVRSQPPGRELRPGTRPRRFAGHQEEHMTSRHARRSAAGQAVHGIDRMVRNVETGRFERSLSALTAAGALVTAAEIFFEHDSASFGNKMMWLPVALGPVGAAAGVAGVCSRRMAKTALPITSAAIVANGVQGLYLHARGIAQKPGGWRNARYNMEMGPPLLAPLLVTMVGGMGLLAAILRREQ